MHHTRIIMDSAGNDEIRHNLPSTLSHGARLSLLRATLTGSPYQIAATRNSFNLSEGGVNFLVTLTPGNYTLAAFTTELATQLNAAGANTYAVAAPAATGVLTITRTAGAATWSFQLAAFSQIASIMGFVAANGVDGAGPLSGTLPVRLRAAGYYLLSESCAAGPITNIPGRRIAFLANTGVDAWSVSDSLQDELLWYSAESGVLQFSLQDEFGSPAVLNGGLFVVDVVVTSP